MTYLEEIYPEKIHHHGNIHHTMCTGSTVMADGQLVQSRQILYVNYQVILNHSKPAPIPYKGVSRDQSNYHAKNTAIIPVTPTRKMHNGYL